jgi:hypothetical protein
MIKITKAQYMRELYERLRCAHCGGDRNVVLHHPELDGHLGRVGDIPARASNLIARLDAEVARCVPLCCSCHFREHNRIRAAAGWRRFFPNMGSRNGGSFNGWRWLKGDAPVDQSAA